MADANINGGDIDFAIQGNNGVSDIYKISSLLKFHNNILTFTKNSTGFMGRNEAEESR